MSERGGKEEGLRMDGEVCFGREVGGECVLGAIECFFAFVLFCFVFFVECVWGEWVEDFKGTKGRVYWGDGGRSLSEAVMRNEGMYMGVWLGGFWDRDTYRVRSLMSQGWRNRLP